MINKDLKKNNIHILIIDDDEKIRLLLKQFLENNDFKVSDVENTDEAKKIKETAESDIAQSTNKAKETLKEELSVLVVAGASKILNKEIDESANKEIVDQLIKEL